MRSSRFIKLALALSFLVSAQVSHADVLKRKKPKPAATAQLPLPTRVDTPTQVRPLETVRELTIMAYNVLNLKTHVGFFERAPEGNFLRKSGPEDKPNYQVQGVVRAIKDVNPDIAIFAEIEGVETLAEFNRQYLDGAYTTHIVRGNDGRGIEVGLIVKKDLPLTFTFESYRDVTWQDPAIRRKQPLFSRDLPTLIIRRANQPTGPPALIVMGNHGKSKRNRSGDFESTIWRTAQYVGMASIIDDYRARFGEDVPMIVGGDFNTDITDGKEMGPIHERLLDVFDIVGLTGQSRVTHSYFPPGGPVDYQQVDAIFISEILKPNVLSASVYRYKDGNGNELPLPRSFNERQKNPSDHYPVVLKLKTSRIFPEAFGIPVP